MPVSMTTGRLPSLAALRLGVSYDPYELMDLDTPAPPEPATPPRPDPPAADFNPHTTPVVFSISAALDYELDMSYVVDVPVWLPLENIVPFRRGMYGFAYTAMMNGRQVVVVVRVLEGPVPRAGESLPVGSHDADNEVFNYAEDVRATYADYRRVEELQQAFLAQAQPRTVPEFLGGSICTGRTEIDAGTYMDPRRRLDYSARRFGVEVFEAYDMSLQSFLRVLARDASGYQEVELYVFRARLAEMLHSTMTRFETQLGLRHPDFHVGNVLVRLDTNGDVAEMVVSDFTPLQTMVGQPYTLQRARHSIYIGIRFAFQQTEDRPETTNAKI